MSNVEAAPAAKKAKKRFAARPWVRAIHRDAGYLAVGLTVVYAASGLALNHIADWNPNYATAERTHELGMALPDDDDEAAALVASKLSISEKPRDVFRTDDDLEIVFAQRTLHANTRTGSVLDQEQKSRFFLRVANWLHANRGKKAWTYFADAYGFGLLLLAFSGLFMIPGKKGLFGRGAVFVIIGVAIPLLYVTFASN
jgi:uncharacterized protein